MTTLRRQLWDNAIALLSLAIALGSLSYNTWRDERTESNRNTRAASFEILTKLAEFQRLVYLAHYDRDAHDGNPRIGWSYIIVINDLSQVVAGGVQPRAGALRDMWRANWEKLGQKDDAAIDHIDQSISDLRDATLETLRSLH
jgi:hypothetical protein